MDRIELQGANREILGKKVRHLRRDGVTPIHLFGHGIRSQALQCSTGELEKALSQAGYTGLISLKLDHEKRARTVVIREFHRDWRKGQLLHVDFYQVKMGEKIKLEVPVVTVGEAPALKSKENVLDHEFDSLTIECLPGQIPSSIEVDVSEMAEPGHAVRIKDLTLGEGVTVLNDPELVVVKISKRHIERIEEEPVEEAVAMEAEEAEAPAEAAVDEKESAEA